MTVKCGCMPLEEHALAMVPIGHLRNTGGLVIIRTVEMSHWSRTTEKAVND